MANFVQIRPRGLLGEWVKYDENFIYLFIPFFGNPPTGQTRRQIFTLDGSNDADSRKDVSSGCFVDIAPHFGGEIPSRKTILGLDRRFQAKRDKCRKFHIIETTAPISTKFCTTIETTKRSSRAVSISPNKSKMADGRHFENRSIAIVLGLVVRSSRLPPVVVQAVSARRTWLSCSTRRRVLACPSSRHSSWWH